MSSTLRLTHTFYHDGNGGKQDDVLAADTGNDLRRTRSRGGVTLGSNVVSRREQKADSVETPSNAPFEEKFKTHPGKRQGKPELSRAAFPEFSRNLVLSCMHEWSWLALCHFPHFISASEPKSELIDTRKHEKELTRHSPVGNFSSTSANSSLASILKLKASPAGIESSERLDVDFSGEECQNLGIAIEGWPEDCGSA